MPRPILAVVNNPKNWPLHVSGVQLIAARDYLSDEGWAKLRGARVYNLCRSYRYQSVGYYVSLLATARGHRPFPSVTAIQDMRSPTIARFVADDLEPLIQRSLQSIRSKKFTLSIYFGQNLAKRHSSLSRKLFDLFQAPLMRAQFSRNRKGEWVIDSLGPIPASEIPDSHHPFVIESAGAHFARECRRTSRRRPVRCHLAILHTPTEDNAPSNEKALRQFERIGRGMGIAIDRISKSDLSRLLEFDALFIRDNTSMINHAYRFARRATAEGLIVIDHPDAIFRCNNKVYLAETLRLHHVPTPKTMIVSRENLDAVTERMGLPCILKEPDGTFSMGVRKVTSEETLRAEALRMLESSDLLIAQEFFPTDFDWRIGVLGRQPLFAAKYHMAPDHWQIIRYTERGEFDDSGRVEAIPVEDVPPHIMRAALRAANLIGDGLFGVDVKQRGQRCSVIEVNENPNIDKGSEDQVLGDELYRRVLSSFVERVEAQRRHD